MERTRTLYQKTKWSNTLPLPVQLQPSCMPFNSVVMVHHAGGISSAVLAGNCRLKMFYKGMTAESAN